MPFVSPREKDVWLRNHPSLGCMHSGCSPILCLGFLAPPHRLGRIAGEAALLAVSAATATPASCRVLLTARRMRMVLRGGSFLHKLPTKLFELIGAADPALDKKQKSGSQEPMERHALPYGLSLPENPLLETAAGHIGWNYYPPKSSELGLESRSPSPAFQCSNSLIRRMRSMRCTSSVSTAVTHSTDAASINLVARAFSWD